MPLERILWVAAIVSLAWYLGEGAGFFEAVRQRWGQAIAQNDDLLWVLYFLTVPVVLAVHCKRPPVRRGDGGQRVNLGADVLPIVRVAYLLSAGVAMLVGGVGLLASLGVPGTDHSAWAVVKALSCLAGGSATTVLALRYFPEFSESDQST